MKQKWLMKYIQLGILGKTGFGKSYLTNKLIKKIKRKIIVDPHAQFEGKYFDCYSLEQFIEQVENKEKFSVNCIFEDISDYERLFFLLWHLSDYLLIIDEVTIFATNYNIDTNLLKILTRGRLKNISVLWNTQRPGLINRTLTSQAYVLISFRLNDIRDLAYLNLDKTEKQELIDLKKYTYKIIYGKKDEIRAFFSDFT